MKRVLLIEIHPDCEIGGAETYNRQLSGIISKNFPNVKIDKCCYFDFDCNNSNLRENIENDYYVLKNNVKKINGKYSFFSKGFAILRFRKFVYKLIAKNNYDLIIDSTITFFKKICNNDDYFWIEHTTPQFFDLSIFPFWKKTIYKIGWFLLGIKNNFKFAKNLVLYDKYNEKYVSNHRKSSFNAYDIPLSYNVPKNYLINIKNNYKERNKIIYFGRIDQPSKNINLLLKINNSLKLIDFYGVGDKELISQLGTSYKGYIAPNSNFEKLFSKYKFLILMSNYEGFSYSAVNALSYGVPIIVRDSFISAKYIVNDGKNGILLPENASLNTYIELIKKFYDLNENKYFELCQNAYEFALINLDNSVFEQKWLEIFNKFLN